MIPMLFGAEYQDSILILNILAISTPLIFLAFNSGAALVTKENIKKKIKYMGLVAMLNMALNIIFIPVYHETGAAIATVITNLTLVILYYFGAKRHVF
jgi:O-antigen/teichoic acid export membrane protein